MRRDLAIVFHGSACMMLLQPMSKPLTVAVQLLHAKRHAEFLSNWKIFACEFTAGRSRCIRDRLPQFTVFDQHYCVHVALWWFVRRVPTGDHNKREWLSFWLWFFCATRAVRAAASTMSKDAAMTKPQIARK